MIVSEIMLVNLQILRCVITTKGQPGYRGPKGERGERELHSFIVQVILLKQ
jgi:hypothetical protein